MPRVVPRPTLNHVHLASRRHAPSPPTTAADPARRGRHHRLGRRPGEARAQPRPSAAVPPRPPGPRSACRTRRPHPAGPRGSGKLHAELSVAPCHDDRRGDGWASESRWSGRRAELADARPRARACRRRPADRGPARRRRRGRQVPAGRRAGRARGRRRVTVLTGRCLDTAESALPYLPFTEIVGRAWRPPPRAASTRTPALRSLLPGPRIRAADAAAEDRRLGPAAGVRRRARPRSARSAAEHAGAAGARGPALGRPVQPGPAGVPALPAAGAAAARGRHLPHRRPAPAPPAAAGAVASWSGCPPSSGSSWPRSTRRRRCELVAPAGRRQLSEPSWCAGPPGAARATRSSPRSWSPAGSASGLPRRAAPTCCSPGSRGCRRSAQRVLRIAAVAGRRVRARLLAAVSGLADDELEQALREAVAHHVLVAADGAERRLRVPARAAARGRLQRPAARRAQPAARRATRSAARRARRRRATAGRAAELAHHALAGARPAAALAASVRAAARGRRAVTRRPRLLLHARAGAGAVGRGAGRRGGRRDRRGHRHPVGGLGGQRHRRPGPGLALGRRALDLAERGATRAQRPCCCAATRMRLLDLGGREQEALVAAGRRSSWPRDAATAGDLAWAHAVQARVLCRLDRCDRGDQRGRGRPASPAAAARRATRRPSARGRRPVSLAVCAEHDGRAGAGAAAARRGQPSSARRAANLGVELRALHASACRCSTRAGCAAAGDRVRRGRARGPRRPAPPGAATGSICGSPRSSPGSCTATGTRRRQPRELAGRVGVGLGRDAGSPRPGCWSPRHGAGSSAVDGGWPSCARSHTRRRPGGHVRRAGGRGGGALAGARGRRGVWR